MLKWSTRTIDFQLSTTLICALVVRLVLISWGEKIDGNFEVKYTDVDYNVFTDAARLMWDGQSPYDRDTYRYPPLLAFLLIPNMIFASFGKILFSLADIGILWQYFSIVEINPTSTMRGVWISLVWVLNLSFAVISTRGSSDSIHNFLILSVLRLIFMKKYALSGVLLGLSIHLRIYPLIFLPALILYILRPQQLTGRMFWSSQTIEAGDNSAYSTMSANRRILKKSFRICPKFVSTRFELDSRFCVIEYSSDSVWNAIRFFLSACTAFIIFTTCAYFLYGWEFLDNAVFYHLKRMDSRHNFSPHFYWLYLTDMTSSSRLTDDMFLNVPVFLSMMTFLPQVLLFSLVTLSMARRDLSACFLLLTFILVAFNKVCTAQYFTWFACFLPVVARVSWGISLKKCVLLFGLWIISLLLWLKCAHSLEFTGTNSFVSIWLGSLIFHIFNVACIILIILISHGVKRG